MNNDRIYKIYGLCIKSEIELYPSILINNPAESYDAEISITSNKFTKNNFVKYSVSNFNFSNNYANFYIKNVGFYEIIDGNKILIKPDLNVDLEEIRKYTLGSALGLLLFQRNIIAIHGGAISINGNGIIISGSIGAGKTTTVASLINKGYDFLTDDISSITKASDNQYYINHCIPHQKLCSSTVEMLGYDKSELYQIDKIKDKYYSPEIQNFIKEPVKLKCLFYLTISDDDKVTYEEIKGASKFKLILDNIFRKEYIPKELYKPQYIKECLNLSNNISIYEISRPKGKNSINEIISIIEELSK